VKQEERVLTKSGKITIAALDHRGSLLKILGSEEEMGKWKRGMVERYKELVSGVLIDPVYGRELVDPGAKCGFLMSMEETGYRGGRQERVTELLPGWSVGQLSRLGAVGAKLLLYYDSKQSELAGKQRELARKVGEECQREGVLFLLEPLTYEKRGEEEILKMIAELRDLPVDIWKLEYPGSREGCRKVSQVVKEPWILLSAGMEYERYKEALVIACEEGAVGMAVGRAVWQEMGEYEGEERERWLSTVAVPRMKELVAIVEKYGKAVV